MSSSSSSSSSSQQTQSAEVLDYLRRKYRILHPSTPEAMADYAIFDPWINPDEGYIPYCSVCKREFEEFRDLFRQSKQTLSVCQLSHPPGCLWYDYFVGEVRKICPSVKIIYKKEKEKEKIKMAKVKMAKATDSS